MEANITNQQVSPNPTKPKERSFFSSLLNQKGNSPLILGAVVLILVVIVALLSSFATYVVLSNKYANDLIKARNPYQPFLPSQRTTQPTPTIDPTANWKTYTNSTYGFSFKYPLNGNLNPPDEVQYQDRIGLKIDSQSPPDCNGLYFILIYKDGEDMEALAKRLKDSSPHITTVGNRVAQQIDYPMDKYTIACPEKLLVFMNPTTNKTDFVMFVTSPTEKYQLLYNQILSTFKFTN